MHKSIQEAAALVKELRARGLPANYRGSLVTIEMDERDAPRLPVKGMDADACPTCVGTGYRRDRRPGAQASSVQEVLCEDCDGTGTRQP